MKTYQPREGRFFFVRPDSTRLHELHAHENDRAMCGVRITGRSLSTTSGLPSLMCRKCLKLGEWEQDGSGAI